jgi:hypothetical protein
MGGYRVRRLPRTLKGRSFREKVTKSTFGAPSPLDCSGAMILGFFARLALSPVYTEPT